MITSNKSFCIVCIANYCRSPVAENLLKKRFGDKYEFFSAGLTPMAQPNMDPRSLKFLKQNNIISDFHTPKKINQRMLNYFDKFLAVDLFVLNQLNVSYPKFRNKFISLSSQTNDVDIIDPYLFQEDEYDKTMLKIKYVIENINLNKI